MIRSPNASLRLLLVVAAVALSPAATAQDAATGAQISPPVPSSGEIGRYTFNPVIDGLMRLDSRTGQVSHCRRRGPTWSCETVADDRAAYEAEIARLAGKVNSLEAELTRLSGKVTSLEAELARRAAAEAPKQGVEPAPPVPPQSVPPSASKPSPPWPGDEEVERAMRYLEGLFHRFLTLVDKLRQEPEPGRI